MSLRFLRPLPPLVLLLAALGGLSTLAAAEPNSTSGTSDPELIQIFSQLESANTLPSWNPNLGGQNFTTCCLKAINEAITVRNGSLEFTNSSYSDWIVFNDNTTELDALRKYSDPSRFPCTAVYNGDRSGAPIVRVPYQWLNDTCPGWQISSKDNLNAWLQPLSGFLVPAVIFCISVPRRRKLELPSVLFSSDQSGVQGYILAPVGATIALVLVTVDTLVWLCICFAFAGPMIISGLYEAMLDNRVIDYLKLKIDECQLTLDMRCRCLMVVLIGNLDLVWNTDDGGYVDGGTHGGSYAAVINAIDDTDQQPLHQRNASYGAGGSDGRDTPGDGYALNDISGRGSYQGVPSNDQPFPVSAGPPSAPSVSPGSPAPVLPHSSVDATYTSTYQPPQIPPMVLDGAFGNTPPPMHNPSWNHPGGSPAQHHPEMEHSPQSQPLAGVQGVVNRPPSPIGHVADQAYDPSYLPGHGQEGPVIPGISFSRASTEPHQSLQPSPLPQNAQNSLVTGFPPAYLGAVSQNRPSTAQYKAPGTSAAKSGVIAASVVAAGIALGGSHDTNRVLLVNHQNGGPLASPWQHMEKFLYDLRIYPDDNTARKHSPRQNAKPCPGCNSCEFNGQRINATCENDPSLRPRDPNTTHLIHQVKTRLKTMLHCQYSFGSVIGAPVVFFLGGFIFALLQSLDTLGDEAIAEGLAFGQWYMTIPHIAIISGLLLAGNNPNILEGVLAVNDRTYPADERTFLFIKYGLAYPSCYKVASLWDRGHNKKQWLETLIKTYSQNGTGLKEDKDIQDLKKKTTLTLADWVFLLFLTLLLLGVPFVLAFVTAYFTPEVGLSCRSLTFTIYLCVQILQIILWIWAYAGALPRDDSRYPGWFGAGGRLDTYGFYKPYSLRWLFEGGPVPRSPSKIIKRMWSEPGRLLSLGFLWNLMYYSSQYFLGLIGIMAAIGGTAMQLMGVYSADICYVTTAYWFAPYSERPMALISVNSAEMIKSAEVMWKPCAITAILFMSVVSFIGWWYQRRMRDLFAQQVLRIDDEKYERKDTKNSRLKGRALVDAANGVRHASWQHTPQPGLRSSSAASEFAAPAVATAGSGGMRAMSESAVASGYMSHATFGGYAATHGPSYRPYHDALRGQQSMPMMSTARMSVASMPAGPQNWPAAEGYAPATAPLHSGVWNGGMVSPPGVGHQGVASPGMAFPHGPAAGHRSFSDPRASFSGPPGYDVPMGGTGLGVYTPGGNPESAEAGATSRQPPYRQTTALNATLREEDEHDE